MNRLVLVIALASVIGACNDDVDFYDKQLSAMADCIDASCDEHDATETGGSEDVKSDQDAQDSGGCTPEGCDDGKPCTSDSCHPETGGCIYDVNMTGLQCVDDDPCTIFTFCDQDACALPKGVSLCDDGSPCTDGSCDVQLGCSYTPVPGNPECDDGDVCSPSSACFEGVCVGAENVSCVDGNACTDDSCDSNSGACSHLANTAKCSKGSFCSPPAKCEEKVCKAQTQNPCDDGNPCTTDTCTEGEGVGCDNTPNSASCKHNDPSCTQEGKCVETKCVPPVPC